MVCSGVVSFTRLEKPIYVSVATFYKWKARYGGLQVSDVRRLKDLEAENGKLKKLLAEQMLDNAGLKGLLAKNF